MASTESAALYIGHGADALAAACNAAAAQRAAAAFDAEDFHSGELAAEEGHSLELRLRYSLESRFLPRCDFLTAGSPGIARAYESAYGVRMSPILNVFPLAEAPAARPYLYTIVANRVVLVDPATRRVVEVINR